MNPRPYGGTLILHILLHEARGIVHFVVDELGRVGGFLTRNAHIEPDALAVNRRSGVLGLELPLGQSLCLVGLTVRPEAEFIWRILADSATHTFRCGKDATVVVIGNNKSYFHFFSIFTIRTLLNHLPSFSCAKKLSPASTMSPSLKSGF